MNILGLAFSLFVVISLLVVVFHIRKTKSVSLFKHPLFYGAGALLIAFILSGIFSQSSFHSAFIGDGNEITTVLFAVLAFGLLYSLVYLLKTKQRIFTLFGLIAAFAVIVLIHTVYALFTHTNTLLPFNDLAVFFGCVFILCYSGIEYMTFGRIKIFLYILGALSFITIIMTGFQTVWYGLGIVSLFAVFHSIKHKKSIHKPIVVLALSVFFAIVTPFISVKIHNILGIQYLDIRPSWALSYAMANQSWRDTPLFGSGPNQYGYEYLKYKPLEVNRTMFWSVDFTVASSYFATLAINLGLVGLLTILFALFTFLRSLWRVYKDHEVQGVDRFVLITGAGTSLLLVTMSFLYNPSLFTAVLGVVFLSVFIRSHVKKTHNWEPKNKYTKIILGIFVYLSFIVLIWATVFFICRAISEHYFLKAIMVQDDVGKLDDYMKKAASIGNKEEYYRGLSTVSIIKINDIILNQKKADENAVKAVGSYLESGISNANKAIILDPRDYQNFIALAHVYESGIPLQVQGAYEGAINSYVTAARLNPQNPVIYLSVAKIEVFRKNYEEALKLIDLTLKSKPDYSDAVLLLAQVQVAQNRITDATESLEYLLKLNPGNQEVLKLLQSLKNR